MGSLVSFSKFKPKNFIPSSSDRFYIEILSFGDKVKDLENDLIYIGLSDNSKRLLVKSADIDEGTIDVSNISLFDYFQIEYPKSWKKPEEISISFIDNHNGQVYKFFHKWADLAGLTKFRGISPVNLHQYSIAIKIIRYNRFGETSLDSEFTIFPKSLPKWVNEYENNAMQIFDINFTVVDYKFNSF
jgi:hypothetical protein